MFVRPINEIISPLPYMTDRHRYRIWRERRNAHGMVDTFNRMAWLGDEAIKRIVTDWLYNAYSSKSADVYFLTLLRSAFENRWTQLVVTVALGLDEEMKPPLVPLCPSMQAQDPRIKAYADILEAYVGGLYSMDREAADMWISELVRKFYGDLIMHLKDVVHSWAMPDRPRDFTSLDLWVSWGPVWGPQLEVKLRSPYIRHAPHVTPLLDDCFAMTSRGHPTRALQHPKLPRASTAVVPSSVSSPSASMTKPEHSSHGCLRRSSSSTAKANGLVSAGSTDRSQGSVQIKVESKAAVSTAVISSNSGAVSATQQPSHQRASDDMPSGISGPVDADASQTNRRHIRPSNSTPDHAARDNSPDAAYFFPHGEGTMPVPNISDFGPSSGRLLVLAQRPNRSFHRPVTVVPSGTITSIPVRNSSQQIGSSAVMKLRLEADEDAEESEVERML